MFSSVGVGLEEEPEPPQSPSGGESLFAPDKLSRSYGKLGFSLREKENAAAFSRVCQGGH